MLLQKATSPLLDEDPEWVLAYHRRAHNAPGCADVVRKVASTNPDRAVEIGRELVREFGLEASFSDYDRARMTIGKVLPEVWVKLLQGGRWLLGSVVDALSWVRAQGPEALPSILTAVELEDSEALGHRKPWIEEAIGEYLETHVPESLIQWIIENPEARMSGKLMRDQDIWLRVMRVNPRAAALTHDSPSLPRGTEAMRLEELPLGLRPAYAKALLVGIANEGETPLRRDTFELVCKAVEVIRVAEGSGSLFNLLRDISDAGSAELIATVASFVLEDEIQRDPEAAEAAAGYARMFDHHI